MDIFDTVLGLAVLLPWVVSWLFALYDIFLRRRDLSVVLKVAWAVIVILLPAAGVAAYVVMRPAPPAKGKDGPHQDEAKTTVVDRLSELVTAHDAGTLSDAEFTTRKAELFHL